MTSTEDPRPGANGSEPDVDAPDLVPPAQPWPSEDEGRRTRLLTLAGALIVCLVALQVGSNAPAEDQAAVGIPAAARGSATPTSSPPPSASPASATTASAAPSPTKPEFPDTPAGRLDKKAYESGWVVETEEYGSASEYANDVCKTFKDGSMELGGWWGTPGQYLAEMAGMTEDEEKILRAGVPKLCPKRWPQVKRAMDDTYERFIDDGTYDVAAKGGFGVMPPGTYRSQGGPLGGIVDCYWERTTGSGDIVDNNFVTVARSVTVTVRTGELFTTESCGVWMPVE